MKRLTILRSYKVYVLVVAVVLIPLCMSMMCRFYQSTPDSDFCTTEDAIYQEIQANAQNWLSELFASTHPTNFHFEMQGSRYTVRAKLKSDGTKIFYISTSFSWPPTPEGSIGYFYTDSGQMHSNWLPGYEIEHLSGNIYCYREIEIR